ncbi:amidase [Bradyrhizobium prioriisuperbiae]|uniref:amidase n=1 Tax=Bradyrhizobium prioriisuperbiae TaxID=2854389 RepID=UPI0028E568DA|nr:amidase family protein [Bradyrhizobium prioritasuperba]
MADDELCFIPATRLAGMISLREVSPVEVTTAVLARAERLQPVLNIFAMLLADEALDLARASEAAVMRGDALGPLHGVPITIKDNVAIGGLPMRNGSLASVDLVPDHDATVTARVKAAGAILIGTTTLPEFAHKVLTDSPLYGITRNPYDLTRTPGGSSGGASAALATGVAPLAIGSDGGGSIRCPASCTGVAGLKATLGRIPNEQVPDSFANYAAVGPMTRVVEDLPLLLSVMSGPQIDDPYSYALEKFVPKPAKDPVRGLRVAWITQFGNVRPEPDVGALTQDAVELLAAAGAHVDAVSTPIFDNVFDTYVVIATTAHAARLEAMAAKWGNAITPSLRQSIVRGLGYSAAEWQRASDRRSVLFRAVQRLFERYDVIVTPTMNAAPVGLDAGGSIESEMYAQWAGYLYPFNLTGNPALSVPCGFTADGLPVGLQLVGAYHDEQRLIDVAATIERAGGWSARRPAC